MQIETIGNFQIHMIAHEPVDACWDAFVTVVRFDEQAQDFVCVLERHKVEGAYASSDEAIEAARQAGNAFIQSRQDEQFLSIKPG